jgi:hypothetical protein
MNLDDMYETYFILDHILVIRCELLGLILNHHLNYFIFWLPPDKAKGPRGRPWLPLWETLFCTIICYGYDELPCPSLFNPAPELADRDKSKELYSFPYL